MPRKPSRIDVEALGLLVTDAIMRAIVPAINQRVTDACASELHARLAPIASQLAELGEQVGAVSKAIDAHATIAQLDERVRAAIQACEGLCDQAVTRVLNDVRPFEYHGAHDIAREYARNDSVTHRGSMWIARKDVVGIVPGSDAGAECWTLAVKCGRDAKGRDA